MLLILSPVFLILAIAIKLDSPGPVFYRQVRVTQYGKHFRIFKYILATIVEAYIIKFNHEGILSKN